MHFKDKERLLTDEKRKMLGKSPLFAPEDFMLADQQILTADFFVSEIEKQVRDSVENGAFIILNDSSVNAYAYRREGYNVVALTLGSIYNCLYTANLFMLSKDFFPDIGNETLFDNEVRAVDFPAQTAEDGEISLPVSGDDERRNIGYIIAAMAIKYMVYHEIGHHVLGHLEQYDEVLGLDCGETGELVKNAANPEQFKRIEAEADLFAAEKLAGEFDELAEKWNPYFEVPLEHLEFSMLMIAALVIVKENLNEELLSVEEIEERKYVPAIVRLVLDMSVLVLEKNVHLREQFRQMLRYEAEDNPDVQSYNPVDEREIELLLIERMSNVAVMAEQVYADIFVGSYDPAVFQSDFLGYEWWRQLK